MKVNQIDISKNMKVSELIAQFEASDVLGAGRVGRATNILANMIKDEDTNVFMSLGGPLIPGGMRNIVSNMIKEGHVDLIVSSGANLTHDLLEAFGGAHYRDEGKDDEELNAEGIGRIADINVGSNDFEVFEKEIIRFYTEKQKAENRQNVTLEELYAEWLLYKRDYTSVKAKTIQEYVSEWNRFFKDTELVKMKIGEIKPITLIRFFREATKDRQFTHKRVSNARSVLNGIMSYAIEEEI